MNSNIHVFYPLQGQYKQKRLDRAERCVDRRTVDERARPRDSHGSQHRSTVGQ